MFNVSNNYSKQYNFYNCDTAKIKHNKNEPIIGIQLIYYILG